MRMKPCGLLGRKLSHSFSPQIHALLGNYPYQLFEKEPEEVGTFIHSADYTALNVTVPYKELVIPFLDALTPQASKIGAVNTILRQNGQLIGENTDYYGFKQMLMHAQAQVQGEKALILGSGGASKTVHAVLSDLGVSQVITISRHGTDNYDTIERHYDAGLIVNATPVGMYPENYAAVLDLSGFTRCTCVLDLIYNPAKTRLLLQAESLGMRTQNGLWMLVAQAKRAAELFMQDAIPDSKIGEIYRTLSRESRNIVLIGMPGCGKSTVGTLLAERSGRKIFSLDAEIEKEAGMSIPEIFARYGESHFRTLETNILRRVAKIPGIILDCGGGIVTRQENDEALQQNGFVVFINRGWQDLPTDGRPLSQKNALSNLYVQRLPRYRALCDVEIDSLRLNAQQTAERIWEAFTDENSCT